MNKILFFIAFFWSAWLCWIHGNDEKFDKLWFYNILGEIFLLGNIGSFFIAISLSQPISSNVFVVELYLNHFSNNCISSNKKTVFGKFLKPELNWKTKTVRNQIWSEVWCRPLLNYTVNVSLIFLLLFRVFLNPLLFANL